MIHRNRIRLAVLAVASLVILAVILCTASPAVTPARAQIDLTAAVHQLESTATAQSSMATARAQVAATAAQRRIELERLYDQQTRTVMEITVSAATAQYTAGQTETPIARTAQAQSTEYAQATGTAQATATQIAGTATATVRLATVAAQQTAQAIVFQATVDANNAQNRQRFIDQGKQVAAVIAVAALTAVLVALCVLIWKRAAKPPKPVVIVEKARAPEPQSPTDREGQDDEGADITNDPRATAYVIDLLREQDEK